MTTAQKLQSFEALFHTIFAVTKHQLRLQNPNLSESELHLLTIERLHGVKIKTNEKPA
jgi:hypothetical protein